MAQTRNRRTPERLDGTLGALTGGLRTADPAKLRSLAERLGELGLNERAVRSCFGVHCVAHALRRPPPAAPDPWPPATVIPRMFVARHEVPLAVAEKRLAGLVDELESVGLIARDQGSVRASVTLLPVGESLAVCGPLPDDSTFHLIGALPTRRVSAWLDVGTGNAIVPLARRGLAPSVLATDIDDVAIGFARVSLALNDASEIDLGRASLLEAASARERWPLITFNAPIPTTDRAPLLDQFWQQARAATADGGEVILHARQPLHGYPDHLGLPGSTVAVRYTPEGEEPAFGVTIWQPSGRTRCELRHQPLSRRSPHISRAAFGLDT